MSLCPQSRCGCSFDTTTLDITRAASGLVTIDMPDAYEFAYPIYTFLDDIERDAEITSPQEGMECWLRSVDEKYRHDGTDWVLIYASNGYSPTLGGSGWGLGSGTAFGWYVVRESMVAFAAGFIFAGDSTFGAGAPEISLPFTPSTEYSLGIDSRWVLNSALVDANGNQFNGRARILSTGAAQVLVNRSDATYLSDATPTSTVPFTFASGDQIAAHGEYMRA